MKIIVGLGNPGEKYRNNRHNVGYTVVDKLSRMVKGRWLMVKKTNVFMNESGLAVKKLIDHYLLAIDHLYVVHDDLDLPLGTWKIQFAKGPKDHGGINDIEQKLGTENFWRIRVGIDNRKPESLDCARDRASWGEEYVLQDFSEDEKKILKEVINKICKKLARL